MAGETLVQWLEGLFAYRGIHLTGPNDPRLRFLEAMAEHEGTFGTTNPNDPFDITSAMGVAGATPLAGNSAGVVTFATAQEGYDAFWKFVQGGTDTRLGELLQDANATTAQLVGALASSGWSAGLATPQARADSAQYAAEIGQASGLSSTESAAAANVAATSDGGLQPRGSGGVSSSPTGGALVAPPNYETQGMNTQYTGPDAYKGFDMSGLPAADVEMAKKAIDAFEKTPGLEKQILGDIFKEFPQDAWLASISQIRTILLVAAYNHLPENNFNGLIEDTRWWKDTSSNARLWEQEVAIDPASAYKAVQSAAAHVVDLANQLGVQLTQAQVNAIATYVSSQTGHGQNFTADTMSDQEILGMITATIGSPSTLPTIPPSMVPKAPPGQPELIPGLGQPAGVGTAPATPAASTPAEQAAAGSAAAFRSAESGGPPATGSPSPSPAAPAAPGAPSTPPGSPVTGTSPGGDSAALYNAFETTAKNYYLNLTPQQIQNYVDQYLKTDTGQANFMSGATAGFNTLAQQMAKNAYPALAQMIDQGITPYAGLSNYRSLIAQYTGYGGDPDTIDLASPQWSWVLTGKVPGAQQPTGSSANQPAGMVTYDNLQKYLMQQPQFQSTDLAKQMGWHVATAITKAFGF